MGKDGTDGASASQLEGAPTLYPPGADPGLKYLKDITLSPEEEAEYTRMSKENVTGILAFEAGTKEQGWRLVSRSGGVQVFSKASAADPSRMMCKGQQMLDPGVTLKLLEDQFIRVYNNNHMLPQSMRASDPMSRETKILCQMPCADDEFIRIVWGSFAAVGVAYARDFCFLQHCTRTTDAKTGERLMVVVAGSIERPEVPDMEKLCKRIRSTVSTSGYVFRESAEGKVSATYVVNFSPNGWIPNAIVNTVAKNQALNVTRVTSRLAEVHQACVAMDTTTPLHSWDIAWRSSHTETISRPSPGAPATVSIKFWGNGRLSFRIIGLESNKASNWKPEEAGALYGDGGWATFNAREAETLEFQLAALEGSSAPPADGSPGEASECMVEWKASGWFSGLTVFYEIRVS